jgi:osmotically-inducible protein OsmY
MRPDAEIKEDVIRELRRDPQVTDPEAIGVAVTEGAVALTGHALTYPGKLAAARAAARIDGVRAVADDLKVRLPEEPPDDAEIARAIANILAWNVSIPEGRVTARVQGGWAGLDGQVDHDYQRHEVERMVRQVRGVTGVTSGITVAAPPGP